MDFIEHYIESFTIKMKNVKKIMMTFHPFNYIEKKCTEWWFAKYVPTIQEMGRT
jgi:hypothetical protein